MIHLPTAAGGIVRYAGSAGRVVLRGEVLARVEPLPQEGGPVEEIVAPFDAIVGVQRLADAHAPRHAKIIGLRRVVVSSLAGRVRWLVTLGPVGVETLVALVANETEGVVRPHRAGGIGFVGERFVRPGQRVGAGEPLIEIRGEEMA
jgi:predicted deacylase